MAVSLLVTAGAGYFVYNQIQLKKSVAVPLQQVEQTPPPVETAPAAEPTVAASTSTAPTTQTESVAAPADTDNASQKEGGVVFKFTHPNAKKVFFISDFNNWNRMPMKKQDKTWSISVKFKPGTYEYLFVVDGKRTKDPNNKNVTPKGRNIVKVKGS